MGLNVKNFAQLVQDQAAAIQTKSSKLIDFAVGAILRAIVEANASVALWLQGLILYVLTLTRLSTSKGSDIDSWLADWGVTRLAATISVGQVTFSRFTPTNSALVPVGAKVQTADGTQTFAVVADASNSAWLSSQNGYLLPPDVASVTVPVQATTGSVSGNVVAGAVNVMYTAIVGVDYVMNAAPFAGGSNAESDSAAQARFPLFIASLSKATVDAIIYAVTDLQLGLQCQVIENFNLDGSPHAGFLCVIVDDGSGSPPQSVLDAAALAVGKTRAGGIMWAVYPPVLIPADVAAGITTAPGYDHNTVVAKVADAITKYIAALPLGSSLNYMILGGVITQIAGVTDLNLTINSGNADIVATQKNRVYLSSLSVA